MAYPYARCFPILYREDFAYPCAKNLPYYIGRILCTPRKTPRKKARIEERTGDVPNPNHQYTEEKPLLLDVRKVTVTLYQKEGGI